MVRPSPFLSRLARDRAGNTIILVAAALVPILAMIGGGVDMSRNYLAASRLQQACDAGVLAARKALGSAHYIDTATEQAMSHAAQRFFDVNYADGAYGSRNRHFGLTLNEDLSICASASVDVPTTVMNLFGFDETPITVDCSARLNVSNTDVMMALDVTGSMNENTGGDSQSKITVLKQVVKDFHAELESVKITGARTRYGFVPYSTNVNVGALLKDEWIVPRWDYQSRQVKGTLTPSGTYSYFTGSSPVSGSYGRTTSTYDATYNSKKKTWSCAATPASTITRTTVLVSTTSETITDPVPGTRTTHTYDRTTDGTSYSVALSGSTCTVTALTYVRYVDRYSQVTEPALSSSSKWEYGPVAVDTAGWRTRSNGCIEERSTYQIDDYGNVDLTRALDLDIDLVPDSADPDTQWRPQFPAMIYARAIKWDGSGSFNAVNVTTSSEYISPWLGGFAACPAPARKLAPMNATQVAAYVDGLVAGGSTYHDIGMIWAARLLSPSGIFASENADISGRPTSRHLIFLTDGQTSSLDLSYGAYGVEPLDKRRWETSSASSLTQTVESRFAFACEEAKKRNISIWFVAFGTELNPLMTECAGEGHYFSANNAEELGETFSKIAHSIGELRISR